jgi:hypothetical protein
VLLHVPVHVLGGRVEEHQAMDFIGVPMGEHADEQAAIGVTHEHIRGRQIFGGKQFV